MKKLTIKKLFSKLGLQIVKSPHKGIDICQDIINFLPEIKLDTIFDVGANIGQSTENYKFWFPESRIYCFEPSPENFKLLGENTSSLKMVENFQIAFGAEKGLAEIEVKHGLGVMTKINRLKNGQLTGHKRDGIISISTIDDFCTENNIERINYLKIDTEGHELEVLKGARNLLNNRDIDILEVEVGINPKNQWHVNYSHIYSFLNKFGYLPFAFYEQTHEWPENKQVLRRVNAAFIRQ